MQNLDKLKELSLTLPETIAAGAQSLVERMGEVIEGIGDKPLEWRPGNLRVVQGTSDRSKLPKGTGIGTMVIGEDIVEAPFSVIPLRVYDTRQMWNPDPEVKQLVCQSPDGLVGFKYGECKDCIHGKFDKEVNRSACNKSLTVLSISGDLTQIFTTNFSKTGYSYGTDWKKAMKTAGVAPYKRTYRLKTETSSKSKNVEALVAEAYAGNKTDTLLWPFLEEVVHLSGEDRKQALLSFREYIESRKDSGEGAPQLENLESDPDVVLLPAETPKEKSESDTKTVTASSGGTKYKL